MNTGWLPFNTYADVTGDGQLGWADYGYASAADGLNARATASGAGTITHYLRGHGLTHSIPTGSTINNVELKVKRDRASYGDPAWDRLIRLGVGGSFVGSNKAIPDYWPYTAAEHIYDMAYAPALSDIANLEAYLQAEFLQYSGAADVDCLQARITYTLPVAPTITSVTPNNGDNNDSSCSVAILGTGFQPGCTVSLRKTGQTTINATNVVRTDAAHITCDFNLNGAAVGAWLVRVTNPDNQYGQIGFTVNYTAPTVTSITPATGNNNNAALDVTISGTGFLASPTVRLKKAGQTDITPSLVTRVNSTTITCRLDLTVCDTTPEIGAWTVRVTNTDTQYGELTNGFTVGYPAPTVTVITPATGENTGSVNITDLAGTLFRTGATVKLSRAGQPDIAASSVVVVSTIKITCTLPITGAAAGNRTVVVTNDDAKVGSLVDGFEITDPTPPAEVISGGHMGEKRTHFMHKRRFW